MAKRKRKTSGRSTASRRKNRTQDRMPAGLITLFAGLVLMALAFVPGSSAWRTMHDVLFGVFGCGSFVLGAALCYLAILYTRGEDLLPHIAKLVLGLIFASGTVIVFSDIPTDQTAAQMTAACYHNGMSAWLSGGALGAVLGGTLLLLCGRPAANLVMAALAACASLYIFDVTPAECWQWLCNVGGSVHEKGLAVHEQNAARRAERLAERAAEEAAAEEYEDYDDDLPEDEVGEGEDYYGGEEPAAPAFHIQPPGWLAGVFHWGHQVMQGGEQAEPAPAPAPEAQTPPQPEPAPVQVEKSRPRAPFDIDLGPDHTTVTEGGSEPIEPIILGPGGTFGMDPLRRAPIRATVTPIVPDAVDTAAEDFFTAQPEPTVTPTVTPAAPAEEPEQQPAPEPPLSFGIPLYDLTPTPEPAPQPVSAENAVAFRSEPDEDGWISITSDPVEEKDLNTLVAAAMEKPAVSEEQAANAPAEEAETEESFQYQYPSIELFERAPEESDSGAEDELKANAQKLVDTLESFGVRTRVLDISRGPSVTRYEVQPMAGVKISRITSLADDIALNLAVADVRMEAPIPGKPAVGIEVPNHKKTPVYIRSVFESQSFLRMTSPMGIALGKDIAGVAQVADLCKMPHLLIAGSTGSGKSVCVNSIIISILFRSSPEDVKLMLIDPKVVELAEYNGIPHLLMPVITEPKKAASALHWAVAEMERRYKAFADSRVRDIKTYNAQAEEKMPYIVIIIDELSDLMMVAKVDVEDAILRLAQKARAAGIHLILATQRPSVDVITGIVKANIPSRIAFAVSSQTDSRTIIDMGGAEKLLGKGDMLFYPMGYNKPVRVQGAFVSDDELNKIVDFIIKQSIPVNYSEEVTEQELECDNKGHNAEDAGSNAPAEDELLEDALSLVLDMGQASSSMLQRRFRIGYTRAARLVDTMEELGIVGQSVGSKPREVIMSRKEAEERFLRRE